MILKNFVTITFYSQDEPRKINYEETVKMIKPIDVSLLEENSLCKIIFTNETGTILENFRFYTSKEVLFFQKRVFLKDKIVLKKPKNNDNLIISYNFYKNRKRESVYYFVHKNKSKN